MKNGKQVPDALLKQIELDKRDDIATDSYNNFPKPQERPQLQQQQPFVQGRPLPAPPPPPPAPTLRTAPRNVNVFSPEYTRRVNQQNNNKPRAQASARVRLGGAY